MEGTGPIEPAGDGALQSTHVVFLPLRVTEEEALVGLRLGQGWAQKRAECSQGHMPPLSMLASGFPTLLWREPLSPW